MKEAIAIGLMSGSSLDGLDIALVRFQEEDGKYRFNIIEAETLPYPEYWTKQLSEAFPRLRRFAWSHHLPPPRRTLHLANR